MHKHIPMPASAATMNGSSIANENALERLRIEILPYTHENNLKHIFRSSQNLRKYKEKNGGGRKIRENRVHNVIVLFLFVSRGLSIFKAQPKNSFRTERI